MNYVALAPLFLRMKTDSSKRAELLSFLETSINNTVSDKQKLAGTPFFPLAEKALEANTRIRDLVLEFQSNNEKIAAVGQVIEAQSASMRGELDRFSEKSMMSGYDFFRVRMVTLILVVFIAGAMLAFLNWSLSRSILRPIGEITAMLGNIAQGEGDLTQRLPITSKIGEVCRLFNVFIEKLHGIVGQVAQTASQVASSSDLLSAASGNLAAANEEMAAKKRKRDAHEKRKRDAHEIMRCYHLNQLPSFL